MKIIIKLENSIYIQYTVLHTSSLPGTKIKIMRLWIGIVFLVTVTFASTLLLLCLDLSYSFILPPPRILLEHNHNRHHQVHDVVRTATLLLASESTSTEESDDSIETTTIIETHTIKEQNSIIVENVNGMNSSNTICDVCPASNSDSTSIDEETRLRFQAVGRLYEQTSSSPSSSTTSSYTDILHKLQQSTVAIIGIGGVGSWAAESICRSGIGNILLLDLDDVCISNTNRQLHTTTNTIGLMKTDVMKKRLIDINPKCNVTIIHDFITEDNVFDIMIHQLLQNNVNVIIDAIDGNAEKAALIAAACIHNIPIITCGGAAGRIDPIQITCQDLSESIECKLLFWTKKKLRNQYKLFPNENEKKKKKMKKWRIPAVFSLEVLPKKGNQKNDDNITDYSSSFRKCDGVLGTASFVTGTYGMIAASQAVKMIANDSYPKPRLIKSSVKYWKELHHNDCDIQKH